MIAAEEGIELQARLFAGFNRAFDWTTYRYLGGVGWLIRRAV